VWNLKSDLLSVVRAMHSRSLQAANAALDDDLRRGFVTERDVTAANQPRWSGARGRAVASAAARGSVGGGRGGAGGGRGGNSRREGPYDMAAFIRQPNDKNADAADNADAAISALREQAALSLPYLESGRGGTHSPPPDANVGAPGGWTSVPLAESFFVRAAAAPEEEDHAGGAETADTTPAESGARKRAKSAKDARSVRHGDVDPEDDVVGRRYDDGDDDGGSYLPRHLANALSSATTTGGAHGAESAAKNAAAAAVDDDDDDDDDDDVPVVSFKKRKTKGAAAAVGSARVKLEEDEERTHF
jgi:hypothetical protein